MKKILTLILVAVLALTLSVTVFADGELTANSAIRVNDNQIVVEFSKALDAQGLDHPFKSIRWCNVDETGFMTLAWDGSTPLQLGAIGWTFYSETDHTKVIVTFEDGKLNEWLVENEYGVYFAMEETAPEVGHDHAIFSDVTAEDGTKLSSNRPGPGGDWDGTYLTITTDYTYGQNAGTGDAVVAVAILAVLSGAALIVAKKH